MELLSLSLRQLRQLLVATVVLAVGEVDLREGLEAPEIPQALARHKETTVEQDIPAASLQMVAAVVEQVPLVKAIRNMLLVVTVPLLLYLARP